MSSHLTLFNREVFHCRVAGLFDAGVRCGQQTNKRPLHSTLSNKQTKKTLYIPNQKSVFHLTTLDVRQPHDRGDFLIRPQEFRALTLTQVIWTHPHLKLPRILTLMTRQLNTQSIRAR